MAGSTKSLPYQKPCTFSKSNQTSILRICSVLILICAIFLGLARQVIFAQIKNRGIRIREEAQAAEQRAARGKAPRGRRHVKTTLNIAVYDVGPLATQAAGKPKMLPEAEVKSLTPRGLGIILLLS